MAKVLYFYCYYHTIDSCKHVKNNVQIIRLIRKSEYIKPILFPITETEIKQAHLYTKWEAMVFFDQVLGTRPRGGVIPAQRFNTYQRKGS